MSALEELDEAVWEELEGELGPLRLPRAYCPVDPTLKQDWFLRRDELEAFFGGAAGPGKSWGLLMAGLQYVDVPGYHALLLRPQLTEFEQPGGLIEVSHDWLDGTAAAWNGSERSWTFPSGATLRFGYISARRDLRQYKGPSYSFCGFDELTGFPEWAYRAMFRVLRQAKGALDGVPLRMRAASNPGDIGHHWVKARFVEDATRVEGAIYVAALIHDNPFLDYEEYLKSLAHLSPIDQMRLINGDWDVTEEGGKFDRERFKIVEPQEVDRAIRSVRYWDLAGSEVTPAYPDPDWTVGLRLEVSAAGIFTIRHVVRGRWKDDVVEKTVRRTAEEDGRPVPVYIEKDPGQAGKSQVSHYKRNVLQGFACHEGLTRLDGKSAGKEVRARPVAAAVGNELVQIVSTCPHLLELLDEAAIFPNGSHDDIVDALSGGHNALTGRGMRGAKTRSAVPRGRISAVPDHRQPGRL